jgi:ribonuclease HII
MSKSKEILSLRFKIDGLTEAGIDEAGRGCFWGPIVAGALIWPDESEWTEEHRKLMPDIRDSKKIAIKKRERIFEDIKRLAKSWGVGIVSAQDIDEKGISWANQEAFRRAISSMSMKPDRILVDGTLRISDYTDEQHTIVDGDATYLSIAGASILAKVTHDHWVQEYCKENPECKERYGLESGHGYGTAKHREGLRTYGAHELHRRTFVYNWVPESEKEPVVRKTQVIQKGYSPKEEKCLIQLPSLS